MRRNADPLYWAIIANSRPSSQQPTHLPCFDSSDLSFREFVSTAVFIKMSFPTDVAEFDSDPRISFSKLDNSFLLETSDGREFLWNSILKRWVESVCNERIRMLTLCVGPSTMLADNLRC
ncbi:hypothetical protein VN97_g7136 [Penicillium thymicola]|uniref:Uncharacterized protein n=1 Tax=Penicillium thymicola TaxID=293382 RepID=A0AAI9TFI5_PENTH|nr:hypothetical protein VN97_g7136 [Penicillium thymicola]